MNRIMKNYLLLITNIFLLLIFPHLSLANGFQLYSQNGAGTGDFNAGGAAEANDASTAWYNPAGLIRLNQAQLVLGAVEADTNIKFKGEVQNYITIHTRRKDWDALASDEVGTAHGDAQSTIPFFHVAIPITDRIVGALSVVAPFGLQTDWPATSIVRYSATKTKIADEDISPSFGIKVTDKFSVGAGLDFHQVQVTANQVSGVGELSLNDTDTLSKNTATGSKLGWHGGLLYQFTPDTRLGLAYHSGFKIKATGESELEGPIAAVALNRTGSKIINDDATARIDFPAMTSLSFFHAFNPQWAVKATANYTEWSTFQSLPLSDIAGVEQVGPTFQPALLNLDIPEHFHNAWNLALGANYNATSRLTLRAGIGYDENPTNNMDRTVRLPEGDVYALAAGAHYQFTKAFSIDGGWTHLFSKDGIINSTDIVGQQNTYVTGKTTNSANLFGLQANWNFI